MSGERDALDLMRRVFHIVNHVIDRERAHALGIFLVGMTAGPRCREFILVADDYHAAQQDGQEPVRDSGRVDPSSVHEDMVLFKSFELIGELEQALDANDFKILWYVADLSREIANLSGCVHVTDVSGHDISGDPCSD
jgi:hypothetical protein